MAVIVQLSDLHLFANPSEQVHIFDELVTALRHVNKQCGPVELLVITGDVFDTASVDTALATHRFAELHRELRRALALDAPTIIVPGNHDRRRAGIIGPHREGLFLALRDALGPEAWVHGCNTPFLAELMPESVVPMPLWIIAYDTTYLPHGLLSAGGAFRQEDLLHAAARIGDRHPDWPILVLLHHHLVPTPLTDLGPIELGARTNAVLRWGVERVLPGIIANADREELTMTALGAGTALSTLHSMGRAVLVLHGHKHYATARMLNGTIAGQGDVIVVSAGSAGVAQAWHDASEEDAARLWPSFNVIDLTDNLLRVDTWAFAWKTAATQSRRPLVRARREGSQWLVEPVPSDYADPGPRLVQNRSRIQLEATAEGRHWSYTCERSVLPAADSPLIRYVETVSGIAGARCIMNDKGTEVPLPTHVHLDVGGVVHFRVAAGLCRTLARARELFGDRMTPFASVGLMNRYHSEEACLTVSGLGEDASTAFASATDLGTGLERPIALGRDAAGELHASYAQCPPRTLLRVYWPLQR